MGVPALLWLIYVILASWLSLEDSNLYTRHQKPVCCHYIKGHLQTLLTHYIAVQHHKLALKCFMLKRTMIQSYFEDWYPQRDSNA